MLRQFFRAETSAAVWRGVLLGAVAGAVGSWAKSRLEPPLQRWGENAFPPGPGEKSLAGADITGHPLNMPPAILANWAAKRLINRTLTRDETMRAMTTIHYVFGIGAAIIYAVGAERNVGVTRGAGVPAGGALWAATHGSMVPLLGLQASPAALPTAWYVWELGSHLGYGLVVELVRRGSRAAFN